MTMYGVDISSWQTGRSNEWSDAEFVIAKATDGVRFVDKTCDPFIQEAISRGQLFGFYHFMNGKHKSSASDQAEYFYNNCKNYFRHGIPILDFEDSQEEYGGAVIKYGPEFAKEFLDRLYELSGVRALIYMSAWIANNYDWSEVAKDYGLWLAGYPGGATYSNPGTSSYGTGAWEYCVIHQYTSDGNLDKNIAYINREQWMKYADPDTEPTHEPTISELADSVMAGKYGNGSERKRLLGDRYDEVQAEVNRRVAVPTVSELANDVIAGKYGNGSERKRLLGDRYDEVQAEVNRIVGIPTVSELADSVIAGKYGNGNERKRLLGDRYDEVQAEVNRKLANE